VIATIDVLKNSTAGGTGRKCPAMDISALQTMIEETGLVNVYKQVAAAFGARVVVPICHI
jgi:hypothetical protein